MPRKKTHDEFMQEMAALSPDIEVLGEYTGRHSPIKVKCKTCGKIWSPSAGDLLMGKGCRQCRIKEFAKGRTKSNDQFLQELMLANCDIEPLEQYINSHSKIKVKCKVCGYIWESPPKELLHGYGCKKCGVKSSANKRKLTIEQFNCRITKSNPKIELMDKYTSLQDMINVRCIVCGNTWSTKAANILYGSGCPFCAVKKSANKRRKSPDVFEKEICTIIPSIKLLERYNDYNTPIKCSCLVCGFKWDAMPNSLLSGYGCKRCSRSGTSFMEQFIYNSFVETLGKENVISRDRKAIGMELDIYIPSCKLAIEPGTWAFHKNSIDRDTEKRKLCKKKSIRLITIYDSFPDNCRPPFEEDCIVFNQDYNIAEHRYIRELVYQLFEFANITTSFSESKWREIEQRAYEDSRAKNTADFVDEINAIRSDIEILGLYLGSKIPIKTRCKKCGNEWNPRPANLLNGSNCPKCSRITNTKRQTKTHEQFIAEVNKLQPQINIVGTYIKGKDHIDAECKICGTKWKPIAASLLNGEGCPKCGLIKKADGRRKTQEQYEGELYAVNPNLEVIGKYTGSKDPIQVRCKVCGYEWTRIAIKLLSNPHHRNEKTLHKTI